MEHKYSGILLHISSLPSKYGIGDLGPGAYSFIDYLEKSKINLWQILPLGPTGYGNSPYSSLSSIAVNPLFISPDILKEENLLSNKELESIKVKESRFVNFNKIYEKKIPIINNACIKFLESPTKDYNKYLQENDYLEDYALFKTLATKYNDNRWYLWPSKYANRNKEAINKFSNEYRLDLDIIKVQQYFFEKQYTRMKEYANSKGINIIGDIPIFVAKESVDTWTQLHLFKTNSDGSFSKVAGVPPDYFTPDGQLWGNPIYNWDEMKKNNFKWWTNRIARLLKFCDIIRIDHFRGFASCYEIDAFETTARNGEWVASPGKELFKSIEQNLSKLPILVEDLGYMTKEVQSLRDEFNYPGMKLLQFGFTFNKEGEIDLSNEFLVENYPYNCSAYPGTHDNQTTLGFIRSLPTKQRKKIYSYFNANRKTIVKSFIEKLFYSKAKYIIIPMQDILEQDDTYRMNVPSTCNEVNWSYKIKNGDLRLKDIKLLENLSISSGRIKLTNN